METNHHFLNLFIPPHTQEQTDYIREPNQQRPTQTEIPI